MAASGSDRSSAVAARARLVPSSSLRVRECANFLPRLRPPFSLQFGSPSPPPPPPLPPLLCRDIMPCEDEHLDFVIRGGKRHKPGR